MTRQTLLKHLISYACMALLTPPTMGQELKPPTFSGFVNVRYNYDNNDASTHGMDIRRVRLSADGALSKNIDYKFQTEYETSVKVIDAFLRWKLLPEVNVQVGEYKVQYSQETLYGPATWLTIENPAAVAKLNGYNDLAGIKANGRDVGITFYGDLWNKLISYRLGMFNGNGINTRDDNNKKDFAGLVWLRPVDHLALSVGGYLGHYGERGAEKTRNRASAGFEWKDDRLTVRSEYLYGKTDRQKSDGVYAIAAYFVTPKLQPLVSVDYFKADRDSEEHQVNYQVGLNYLPIKKFRLQAAYTYIDNKVAEDIHQLEAQFILQF